MVISESFTSEYSVQIVYLRVNCFRVVISEWSFQSDHLEEMNESLNITCEINDENNINPVLKIAKTKFGKPKLCLDVFFM